MINIELGIALRKALATGSIAVLALAALPVARILSDTPHLGGSARAAEDGSHSGGGRPPGRGPGADHSESHDTDHGDDHGDDHGSKGKGKGSAGGQTPGSRGGEGHVPSGVGSGRSSGGRPVWAQEGIPPVELGRLNVSRAPARVLDRALNEAVSEYKPAMAALYSQDATTAAAKLAAGYEDVPRIDSPLQNLALYRQLISDGASPLPGLTPASRLDLAAIFLGTASDKAIPVSGDTVTAVNAILGLPTMSAADTQALAAKAEAVRTGIAAGHGE